MNWNGCSGGNGSPAGTPGPADHAVIGSIAPLADVDLGASARTVDRLTLSAGRIFGDADITVLTRLNWTGGTIDGAGTPTLLQLDSSSSSDIAGGPHILAKRDLRVLGAVTWVNGDIELHEDAEIDIQGQWIIDYSNLIRGGAVPLELRSDGSPLARIHNSSTVGARIEKLGDALARFSANVTFDNGNDVLVTDGTLQINGPGTDFGDYQVAAIARLEFGTELGVTRQLTGSPAVSGAGDLHKFDEGTLDITGGYVLTGQTEVVDGVLSIDSASDPLSLPNLLVRAPGVFSSPDNLVVTAALTWDGGEINGTSAGLNLTIPSGVTATVNLDDLRTTATLRSRNLINQGTTLISGTGNGIISARFTLDSADIDNQGDLELRSNNDANLVLDCAFDDCGSFFNRAAATLRLNDLQGIAVVGPGLTTLDNAGLVDLVHGCGQINSPGVDTGTYRLDSNCTLAFFTRPDTERVFESTLVLNSINSTGIQAGGSLRVNGSARSFGDLIIETSGTLFGPAAITFTGSTEWRGLIEGTSSAETVTVAPGATLQTSTDSRDNPLLFARTLINNGDLNLRVRLQIDGNAQIQNNSLLNLMGSPIATGAIGCDAQPPCGTVTNTGSGTILSTALLAGPPASLESNIAVVNQGALRVDTGVLQMDSDYTAAPGSVLEVLSGAGLRRLSGSLVLAAGSVRGAGVIEANVDADAVAIQPAGISAGNLAILGNFTATASTTYQMGIAGTVPPAAPQLGSHASQPQGVPTYDRLTISGSAALNGTLDVVDLGYVGSGSDVFDLMFYASHNGSVSVGANPYSGVGLNIQIEATRIRLASAAGGGCVWNQGGGGDDHWTNPLNWTNCTGGTGPGPGPAGTPGAADIAIIGGGSVVNLDVPVTVAELQFTGGSIGGANNLAISNQLIWTGGSFQGSPGSQVALNAGAAATFSGGQHTIDTRTFALDGSADWTTGLIELANGGVLEIGSSGVLNSNPSLAFESIFGSGSGTAEVRNAGSLVKSGPNYSGIGQSVQYSGTGAISVNSGDFTFAASSLASLAGNYSAAAGATLQFVGGDRSFGPSATLAGGNLVFGDSSPMPGINIVNACIGSASTVVIRNAEVVLNCAGPSNLAGLQLMEPLAVLEGSSAIRVTGSFGWGHGTIRGTGLGETFEIAPAASAIFDAPRGPSVPRILSNRHLRNDGAISWIAENAIEVNNDGQFTNESGGQFFLVGSGARNVVSNAPTTSRMINNGNIGIDDGAFADIDVAFDNAGSVQLIAGDLRIGRNGTDLGSYAVGAGDVLYFDGATRAMGPGADVSGAGMVRLFGGASVTTNGTFQPHDLRIESSSVVQIDSALPQLIQTLFLQSATLTGNAEVRIGTYFDWGTGGIVASVGASPGPLVVQSGALLDMCGGLCELSNRVLLIEGLADWSGGVVEVPMGAAGKIAVAIGGTLRTNSFKSAVRFRCAAPTCTVELEVAGRFEQVGDGADFELTAPLLVNGGTLVVASTSLSAPGVTLSSGAIELAGGDLFADPVVLNSGVLRGNGNVFGNVNNIGGRVQPGASPGQIDIFGSYTQGPAGILDIEVGGLAPGVNADFLFVSGAASIDGTLNVTNAGFPLTAPDTLDFLNSDSGLSGTFAVTNIAYPGYDVSYGSFTATLTPTGVVPLVVNNVGDSGTGGCTVAECTLREALTQANTMPDPDVIEFAIPALQCSGPGGACVIAPTSALPVITGPVLIDGYSQPGSFPSTQAPGLGLGSAAVLQIELDGAAASGADGLVINAPSMSLVEIHGLSMYRWNNAIHVQGPGDSNQLIGGNFIGLRVDGTLMAPMQGTGIAVFGGHAILGGGFAHDLNVIGGNSAGIRIGSIAPGSGVLVQGNLIGTAPDGLAARPNQLGIDVITSTEIPGVVIGGNQPDHRNVISGNSDDGVSFTCTAVAGNCFDGALVQGNFIGPAANASPLGNAGDGVVLSQMSSGIVVIGGVSPGAGNVIAFNAADGIRATSFSGVARASFLVNEIFGNGGQAIDLGGDGRSANDAGDGDTGPNGLLNFPNFTSYTAPGGNSAVIDLLLSTPDIGGNYPARVDFYKAVEDEPGVWLGSTTCAQFNVNCPASFAFPGGVTVNPDDVVLGIVTDGFGKSSEASFYATATQITATTPDPSPVGTPYTVSVEVSSPQPFAPLGAVAVDDGTGNSCNVTLSQVGIGLSSGNCQLPSLAPAGGRTITAQYVFDNPLPARPFTSSSAAVGHTIAGTPPVVTLISPSSGPVAGGTVVTLTGTNFVIGSTSVFFGTSPATGVNCTSTTQCTATSPAGSGTVSVRATTADGTSADTLADDFAYGAITACTNFAPASFFPTGSQPRDLALGDFNGDGHRDLAVANSASLGSISVLLGSGTGSFAAAVDYPVGSFPRALAIGDFNGDGNEDLVAANYGATNVSILLGTGAGTFGAASAVTAGLGPHGVAVGDFNGDGRTDLAVVLLDADSVAILLGNGDGSFTAPAVTPGLRSVSVGVGDFDRDGRSDFLVGNVTLNTASVLLGTGGGSFGAASQYGVGTNPRDLAIADFNNDGISDLALANRGSGNVSVLLGAGDGSFAAATNVAAGTQPGAVATGDFDGDGDTDLIVANSGGNNVSLLLGTGVGAFGVATNINVGNSPSSVAFADFDGDNRADIVTSNEFSNDVAILLSLGCPPSISLINPTSGPDAGGTVVTLSGSDFVVGATSVNFGSTPATAVNCPSTIQCTATSPAGSGVVSISAVTAAGTSANTAADDFTYIPAGSPIVNSFGDPGTGTCDLAECTLREAISMANASAGLDTINFDPVVFGVARVITLTAGELIPTQDLNLVGPGAALLDISGNGSTRLFDGSNVNLSISGATLSGGNAVGSFNNGFGGAIHQVGGSLNLTDVVLSGNACSGAGAGGALVFLNNTVNLTRTTLSGNSCDTASAISMENSSVTIVDGTVSGNSSTTGSALILRASAVDGSLALTNVTISGNSSVGENSAIQTQPFAGRTASVTLTNSTVSGNTTSSAAGNGAIWQRPSAGTHLIVLRNSIVAGNTVNGVAKDIEGTADASSAFNVIGSGGGLSNGVNGNQVGINAPLLAPLANYGGATQTRALLPGSPAINAGSNALAPAADQRGIARPQLGTVDVGAFESRGFVLSLVSGTPQTTAVNTMFAQPLVVGISANAGAEPVNGGQVLYSAPGAGATAIVVNPATIAAAQASITATANGIAGSYSVSAAAAGASGTPTFALTNGLAATSTSISGILPTTSVVGQAYTVTVSVLAGVTPVSTGIVEVRQLSDGAMCTINLASANGCQLVAHSALTTAVRANYLGAGGFAPSQSTTMSHGVDRAATSVLIVSDTPDPSQVLEPVLVTADVSVTSPGAGTPTGEVLVTDGTASCTFNLPARSCSLIPKALGAATIEARYQGDANFTASVDTESHTIVVDGADLSIVKRNGLRLIPGGQPSSYILLVSNAGPQGVVNARVTDILPVQFANASWTCSANAGAACPASGAGTVDALVSLPAGSSLTFVLTATAQAAPEQIVSNRATVTPPLNAPDPVSANNESTDTDPIGVFGEGFETEDE